MTVGYFLKHNKNKISVDCWLYSMHIYCTKQCNSTYYTSHFYLPSVDAAVFSPAVDAAVCEVSAGVDEQRRRQHQTQGTRTPHAGGHSQGHVMLGTLPREPQAWYTTKFKKYWGRNRRSLKWDTTKGTKYWGRNQWRLLFRGLQLFNTVNIYLFVDS